MTRDEELLNEIIQRRGYLVVTANCPIQVGETIRGQMLNADYSPMNTKACWYCIEPTDRTDIEKQIKLMIQIQPETETGDVMGPYFYRVLSD